MVSGRGMKGKGREGREGRVGKGGRWKRGESGREGFGRGTLNYTHDTLKLFPE